MKVIAFYLPQFHRIPENDKWWGEGFTEWTNVKRARPLYEGHYQPREPLNDNYYNLLDSSVLKWQVNIAKKYGVYGFCFYHYWFDGKLLLEKPVEMFLENKNLKMPFCLCWANENWTNGWAAQEPKILLGQTEGNKEMWKKHFEYWLPFFKDERYIRENDKPLLVIYKPDLFSKINEMLDYWNQLAMEAGFKGLTFASQLMPKEMDKSKFDLHIDYEPTNIYIEKTKTKNRLLKKIKNAIKFIAAKLFKMDLEGKKLKKLPRYDYSDMWNAIINLKPYNEKVVPGAFVDWDNTARKGQRGYVIDGANPEKFYNFMKKQIINAKENYKKNMIFLFAWNEWAESGYLEPDKKFGYGYLEALKRALEETRELNID